MVCEYDIKEKEPFRDFGCLEMPEDVMRGECASSAMFCEVGVNKITQKWTHPSHALRHSER